MIITVAEYVIWRQPELSWLAERYLPKKQAEKEEMSFRRWKAIMEERPLPGNAGILPGEVAG